jgi:cytochrome c oxidase subunit 3
MTRHHPSPSWAHGRSTLGIVEQRDDLVQFGVWMFLATVVMLFSAFTSVYIVQRGVSGWTAIDLPPVLKLNIAVLVGSSAALEWGRFGRRRGEFRSMPLAVTLATGLGIVFLFGQFTAWQAMAAQGILLSTNPHGAFVYVLTGVHGVHVVAGLVVLAYTAARSWMSGREESPQVARLLTAAVTFWHFLAALWVYVFLLIAAF